MKLNEIDRLKLAPETVEELPVDPTRAVLADEFRRKDSPPTNGVDRDYRHRALRRLTSDRLPIHSDGNLAFLLSSQFVAIACPYCYPKGLTGDEAVPLMKSNRGGGNGDRWTTHYDCPKCGATAHLGIDEFGLSFHTKEDDE